ncbi:MAG: alpha-mannosidase [bacterium]
MENWPPRMLRYPDYTRARLRKTVDRLAGVVHQDRQPLDVLLVSPEVGRIGRAEAQDLEYRPALIGERFGPLWATYWFRLQARVPMAWAGSRVDLIWVTGGESLLWVDGRQRQGLVTGEGRARSVAPMVGDATGGELIAGEMEVACNQDWGAGKDATVPENPVLLERAEIARFDADAWRLLHDFRVLQELVDQTGNRLDPSWAGELLAELNRFCNVWDPADRATWSPAAEILAPLLERRNGTRSHEQFAIGHGHLDTAWLWPIAETYRKCQRTFATQLALLREYPEYRFASSAAQHYAWVKEGAPELFEEVKEQVRAGRWEVVGGSWVEPDCNLPSGESLARQFLYGQRFFEREFGRRCRTFWNPDVFGYTNQLPQLIRGAGMTRFLTQKLSWNRFTEPPEHTFSWQGLDGSRVTTHFPPSDTYAADATVAEVGAGAEGYKNHDRSRHSLFVFGYGDGGCGPTPEMLETLTRARDLQGLPRTTLATSEEFFDALEADAPELPVVVGELYLEFHRGTYTSQAAVKRDNRRGEALLHDAEFLSAAAARLAGRSYPAAELGRLWQLLLLNQFHDILPGSSIGEVYVDAARQLTELAGAADELRTAAAEALVDRAAPGLAPVNLIGAARAEVSEQPGGELTYVEAPPYGFGRCTAAPEPVRLTEDDAGWVLDNGVLRARVSRDGTVTSLTSDDGREALAAPGNRFELYDDQTLRFDAWDVEPYHLETARPCGGAVGAGVERVDPLRCELRFEYEIGARSRLGQTVRLDAGASRLEFHTDVEWRERHRMLKVAFPLAVHADRATYEMAFGHVERPNHYSTAADLAKYEVPGHRWADMSEHGYGVALLNDSKYGHSAYGNVLRLSLLRAPTSPDPDADQGEHRFGYALLPHTGDWRDGGVVAEAHRFNSPLLWVAGRAEQRSLAAVDSPDLVLDTIKLAEDGEALVLRLYEAHGARGTARIRLGVPFRTARFANLLEDPGDAAEVTDDGAITVPYLPYQICTLLVD